MANSTRIHGYITGAVTFVASFLLTTVAFATDWPGCAAANAADHGPCGGNPNHATCTAYCYEDCGGIADRTVCISCCTTDESNPPGPCCTL